MRKIKKFYLNKSQLLSSEEMVKLNGGEYLYTACNEYNVGASCIYTEGGLNYTGICTYEYNYSSGSGSSSSSIFYCKKS